MHSFARTRHRQRTSGEASANKTNETRQTRGLILNGGWRYDLHGWFNDTVWFRGQVREMNEWRGRDEHEILYSKRALKSEV